MNKKNRDSHQVRDRLSSGVLGEKTEEHYIQRGLGRGDHNQNIDYHIAKICDIPSQLFDVQGNRTRFLTIPKKLYNLYPAIILIK